ncbi:DNA-directed RNA polymerase specialized sigma subunit, sigma24 homolog [Longilinea arvoryzae]|uniref:DNA-directed RNA polymerase specialized sigma subunit, sigma24 homolog n=1 Tax=Longilinea arvoryzae TaxID=360412 RepID=A0A0K8MY62_9CHLR|nr:sigma-70 family RNA polymerase sigma factor [Longilinea arvoryzae]GAP16145.1 DNA-directed RNA polymerase specialized sigma subunit, sigma24 homolog [Longilinea arvoryzae]
MILTTPRLVEQAATDPAAFAELYQACFPAVFQYIQFRCDSEASVQDLTAQVFEKVLQRLPDFHSNGAPFEAWLFAIARNTVTDWQRRQRLRRGLPWEVLSTIHSADPAPEEAALQVEERRQLVAALAQLSGRERDLLGLRFASGLKNCEIARVVGLDENHVAVLIYRALRKLRGLLRAIAEVQDER